MKDLILVYGAYAVAAGSPGASNMAIMNLAMRQGRGAAMALAAGVVTMSFLWGLIAATGLSALLLRFGHAMTVLKMVGGLYLLWLAYRSGKAALAVRDDRDGADGDPAGARYLYRQGLMLHLGNPKSVLSWLAIMALGVGSHASPGVVAAAFGGCVLIGATIFFGYAILFSAPPLVRAYARARRWIEGALCLIFISAGLRLILVP